MKDFAGKRFGKLLVIRRAALSEVACAYSTTSIPWLVRCDCGTEKVVYGNTINRTARPVRSCGCLRNKPAVNRLPPRVSSQKTMFGSMKAQMIRTRLHGAEAKEWGL